MTVALQGDLSKPRPALVVQADRFETTASVTVLPVTNILINVPLLRLSVPPDERNGMLSPVQFEQQQTLNAQGV